MMLTDSVSPRRLFAIASLLFFLSGLAALTYEVIWFKRLSHIWGSSTQAHASVVAAFLVGLALGAWILGRWADRLRRPMLAYGVLEAIIGVYALAIPWLLDGMVLVSGALYPSLADVPILHFATRVFFTFVLIGPVCFLMGGTLPIMMRFFANTPGWNQNVTGWLYAINTLGAAAGVYLAGFYLLPTLGMVGVNWIAVFINLDVALIAILLQQKFPRIEPGAPEIPESQSVVVPETPLGIWLIHPVVMLTGAAAFVLQVVWTRQLAVMLGGTTYAFSAMLVVFLVGIGLGSFLYSRFSVYVRNAPVVLWCVMVILLLSVVVGYSLVPALTDLVGFLKQLRASPVLNALICLGVSACLQLIPTLCMGFLFPFLVDQSQWKQSHVGVSIGRLYTWNTAGSVVGVLLTPVGLISTMGLSNALVVALCLYALAVLLLMPWQRWALCAGHVVLALMMAGGAWMTLEAHSPLRTDMGLYLYGYFSGQSIREDYEVLYFAEGASANVLVTETDGQRSLRVNGKVDASDEGDMPMQMGLSLFPHMLHPEARSVLVIGYGSGTTAGMSLLFPDTEVVCCEIEPEIINAGALFSHVNLQPRLSSRFTLKLDDGRAYLQGSETTYDLILSEPSNPWMSGLSNLFTLEFYQHVNDHLTDDGIFTQWIQTYHFDLNEYALIARTILHVFPHAALIRISEGDTLFLASRRPLTPDGQTLQRAQALIDGNRRLQEAVQSIYETSEATRLMLSHYWLDETSIRGLIDAVPDDVLHTDQNMRLEFDAPLRIFLPDEVIEHVDNELLRQNDAATFIQRFEQWGAEGNDAKAALPWIRSYARQNELGTARELNEFALSQTEPTAELLANRVRWYHGTAEAFPDVVDELIAVSVADAHTVGRELLEREQVGAAAALFEQIMLAHPQAVTAWVYRGICLMRMGQQAEAEQAWNRALEIDPTHELANQVMNEWQPAQ